MVHGKTREAAEDGEARHALCALLPLNDPNVRDGDGVFDGRGVRTQVQSTRSLSRV